MKRPTLADAAHKLLTWEPRLVSGLTISEDGTVSTNDISNESTITPGRSDKDQVFRWLYYRYSDLCEEWMDWAETKLKAEAESPMPAIKVDPTKCEVCGKSYRMLTYPRVGNIPGSQLVPDCDCEAEG